MIRLLEPPASGRITGGFRYNEEVARRLTATGLGEVEHVTPEELAAFTPAADDVLVLDSLYLATEDPPAWIADAARTVLLLHYLPSLDPTLTDEEQARAALRETAWLAAVTRVVATSERLARKLHDELGHTVAAATPGVSPCFRPGADERDTNRVVVVCVGTITAAKGQRDVARALATAAGDRAVQLVLIGDDAHDPGYLADVREAAIGLDLQVTGCLSSEDVAAQLRAADLFVSGSVFESYGMAVAEAIASEVPVVAYRTGELDRWVHESENGYLVEPGDAAALATVIGSLLAEPARLDALRQHDRAIFFPSWEYTFERFLRAVESDGPLADDADEPLVTFYSRCELPTHLGSFEVEVYRLEDGEEALLIFRGELAGDEPPFVRVHSECFTGEILGSLKCDCRHQLDLALEEIAERGRGAVVYLRQEGRGIGLGNKIRAYAEQEKGADTIEANERLGFPADLRDFRVAAVMLGKKGVTRVALNTNNPNKVASLEANGITVEQVLPSNTDPNPHNLGYLVTKYHAMGHAGLERALHRIGALPHANGNGSTTNGNGAARKPLLVFDVDGVVQQDAGVPEEALAALARLREDGYSIRFLTNDGINSRASRRASLAELGLELSPDELYTASSLTARYIAEHVDGPILALCGRPALDEFASATLVEGTDARAARAVVVGDWFGHYDYETLKAAYDALASGAELIAMHRKRSWPTQGKRVIDIGFWVAGLEFAAGRAATIVGKPSAYSYRAVLADAGFAPHEAIMISDEEDPDLLGAREAGLRTMLFRPGGGRGGVSYAGILEEVARL